jgi:hypothetical protein
MKNRYLCFAIAALLLLCCDHNSGMPQFTFKFGFYSFSLIPLIHPYANIPKTDTISNGDSIVLAFFSVKVDSSNSSSGNAGYPNLPAGIPDSNVIVTCDNNIIVAQDTIKVGDNLFLDSNKKTLYPAGYQEYSIQQLILIGKQVIFVRGANLFYLEGVDNYGILRKDTCSLFVR